MEVWLCSNCFASSQLLCYLSVLNLPKDIHKLANSFVEIHFLELYMTKMFQLMLAAYSTISIKDAACFLGMNQDDATKCKISLALVFLLVYQQCPILLDIML